MSEQRLDLSGLALDRPSAAPASSRRPRPWVSRYAVPGAVLLGFASLLVVAARDRLVSARPVTVVPVVVRRAAVQQEGTPLFQAAGWVEPRPTPVNVAALTEGVVDELLVVEGQDVEAGQPIARLIDVDQKLALRQSQAALEIRRAELADVEAEVHAARLRVENPVHLEAVLAEARSQLAKDQTALAQLPYRIDSAAARVDYATQNLEGKERAAGALAGLLIQEARSKVADEQAQLEELKQRSPRLEREVAALQDRVQALSKQRELLIEESRAVASAEARLKLAKAAVTQAELAVEQSQLALDRTTVRSPITGRVLRLISHPGARVMGLETTAGLSSSTVAALYDPHKLQVRADVRLEDVPLVQVGQPVQIETASSAEPITGTVLLPTSAANIQKNTLEVKVAIDDPPAAIRPEMLVTATFLAPPQINPEQESSEESERLLVPRQLVQSTDAGSSVWIVSPEGKAESRSVTLGRAGTEQLVEVVEGLRPTDKLISSGHEGLAPGDRVQIAGEDANIGLGMARS